MTANTPGAVGDLYRFASSKNGTSQTRLELAAAIDVAAKMREAALKSSIFVGVPRVSFFFAIMYLFIYIYSSVYSFYSFLSFLFVSICLFYYIFLFDFLFFYWAELSE